MNEPIEFAHFLNDNFIQPEEWHNKFWVSCATEEKHTIEEIYEIFKNLDTTERVTGIIVNYLRSKKG